MKKEGSIDLQGHLIYHTAWSSSKRFDQGGYSILFSSWVHKMKLLFFCKKSEWWQVSGDEEICNRNSLSVAFLLLQASLTKWIVSRLSEPWFTDQNSTDVPCLLLLTYCTDTENSMEAPPLLNTSSYLEDKTDTCDTPGLSTWQRTQSTPTATWLHHAAPSFSSLQLSSLLDPQIVKHMFNCILLPPSHTGFRPLRGSRSSYTPTVDQAIVISAEGNHCKGTDPAENGALIAVPFKPNVHGQITPVQCSVQQSMKTHKLLNEGRGQMQFNHLARNCRSVRCSQGLVSNASGDTLDI